MSAPQQVVWKFLLDLDVAPQTIQVPIAARLVHIAWFQGSPTLWYLVETDPFAQQRPATTARHFQTAATGQTMPPYDQAIHHGTVIQNDTFVWHIFELTGDHDTAATHRANGQP